MKKQRYEITRQVIYTETYVVLAEDEDDAVELVLSGDAFKTGLDPEETVPDTMVVTRAGQSPNGEDVQ
jgi:hypothetical protein